MKQILTHSSLSMLSILSIVVSRSLYTQGLHQAFRRVGTAVLAIAMLCLLPAAASHAQVYRVVDENGNVTFTDKPPPDAEKIDVRAPNTSAPPVTSAFPKSNSSTADPEGDAEAEGGYRVTITAPSDETVIPRGAGNFTVSASVVPSPQSGEQFQLLVDGAAHLDPQPGTSWSLTNVSRGEHSIAVAVVDGSGARISTSDSIKVYVYRPSLNDAVNNPPPRPTPRLGLPRSN